MLNFYPWGVSLNQVLPLGPARSRVIFANYVADRSLLGPAVPGHNPTLTNACFCEVPRTG